LNWAFNEYCQMPEASYVYRKLVKGGGSTPAGVGCILPTHFL